MPRITNEDVALINDEIAYAPTTKAAFAIINGASRTMLGKLLDRNHIDADTVGLGRNGRGALGLAHGWHWSEQDDDRPADGHGPCAPGFDPHSRRPWFCRHCGGNRRRIDHRPQTWQAEVKRRQDAALTLAGVVPHPPVWPHYIDNR